eukprot:684603-Prymnesium_polylepis.1
MLVAVAAQRQLAPQIVAALRGAVGISGAVPRREDCAAGAGGARKHDEQHKGGGLLQRRRERPPPGRGHGDCREQHHKHEHERRRRGEQHAIAEAAEALCGQDDAGPVELDPGEELQPLGVPFGHADQVRLVHIDGALIEGDGDLELCGPPNSRQPGGGQLQPPNERGEETSLRG